LLSRIEKAGATPSAALDEAAKVIEDALGLQPGTLGLSLDSIGKRLLVDLEAGSGLHRAASRSTSTWPSSRRSPAWNCRPISTSSWTHRARRRAAIRWARASSPGSVSLCRVPRGARAAVQLVDYDPVTGTGTHLDLTASLRADDVMLQFSVGKIALGVFNGSVVLDEDGKRDTLAPAVLRVALDKGRPTVIAKGGLDIELPVNLVALSRQIPLGTLGISTDPALGSRGLPTLLAQIAGIDTGPSALKLQLPDFSKAVPTETSLLDTIYNPTFLLDGIDLGLGSVQDLFQNSLASDIPLIGTRLADAGQVIGNFRAGILADLRVKLAGPEADRACPRRALQHVHQAQHPPGHQSRREDLD
jgi:hypothetical protein